MLPPTHGASLYHLVYVKIDSQLYFLDTVLTLPA